MSCYIPIGLVDPETTIEDQKVKCWKDWCYFVGEPYEFTQPNNTDDANNTDDSNTTQNETLCFTESDCFFVKELEVLEGLTTPVTTFTFNKTIYAPIDFAYNIT